MRKSAKNKLQREELTLRSFYAKRNQVLINHEKGGLGDVFMHRMMFEDFKNVMPEGEFVLGVLPEYIEAAEGHPYISKVLNSREIDYHDYLAGYNTCVTIADRYESIISPKSDKHRSDIWANRCGVSLHHHEMHFNFSKEEEDFGKKTTSELRKNKALVAFSPNSAMISKTLLKNQMKVVVDELKRRDCSIVSFSKKPIPELESLGIQVIHGMGIKKWMSCVKFVDYVISVDTAMFHLAGGLKKPLMGIFTFCDGKIYGKYFEFILVQKHRDNGDWDCGPCFKFSMCPKSNKQPKPCLTEIDDEMLINGIEALFKRWPLTVH